jgi:hypothetical protein
MRESIDGRGLLHSVMPTKLDNPRQLSALALSRGDWIPAFAGMTISVR